MSLVFVFFFLTVVTYYFELLPAVREHLIFNRYPFVGLYSAFPLLLFPIVC